MAGRDAGRESPTFVKIAHRGASAYEPENTIRSFERAIGMKAEMVEFDVRQSLDGRLVVIHDAKVDRTTGGKGPVAGKTLAELKELDAGKGERIPTFEEALDACSGRAKLVIELKESGIEEKVIREIGARGLGDDVFIVSFNAPRLRLVKALDPGMRTGLIMFASGNPVALAERCGADAVAPFRWFITKGLVERARSRGLYTFTWTVDDEGKARALRDMGVTGIVTNRPDILPGG
ncbi:MAG: glycerophosphodiester phosphodiesterase [Candidatus Dadabacteria bacterium]|nr:glycerophosphodiester phosphodiesterase [Candidatus Dadabacteria bacterium]